MSAKLMKFGYGRGGRRNELLILNPVYLSVSDRTRRPTEISFVSQIV